MITRRTFLMSSTVGVGAAAFALGPLGQTFAQMPPESDGNFEITRTPEEWRAILTPAQYAILREEATEYPFTNTLLVNHPATEGS